MKRMRADFEFVEYMPPELKEGIIYVSMVYATASHLCMCGCGERIVTPFSPTDWKLTFDGDSISIFPSIGNWDLTCRSHYYITNNLVRWAPAWTREEVARARVREEVEKNAYYGGHGSSAIESGSPVVESSDIVEVSRVDRLLRFLGFRK